MLTENEIKELTFEEGLEKLEELVAQLDDGDLSLEESISYYEIGIKLKSHCEKPFVIIFSGNIVSPFSSIN